MEESRGGGRATRTDPNFERGVAEKEEELRLLGEEIEMVDRKEWSILEGGAASWCEDI